MPISKLISRGAGEAAVSGSHLVRDVLSGKKKTFFLFDKSE